MIWEDIELSNDIVMDKAVKLIRNYIEYNHNKTGINVDRADVRTLLQHGKSSYLINAKYNLSNIAKKLISITDRLYLKNSDCFINIFFKANSKINSKTLEPICKKFYNYFDNEIGLIFGLYEDEILEDDEIEILLMISTKE